MDKFNKRWAFGFVVFLFFANFLAWAAVYDLSQPQFLEVSFFDVGQGDAAFIETPSGHQIIIDGGPGAAVLEKLDKKMPFWDRTIDLIILSHPEKDHLAGLIEVLKRYQVENILWSGVIRETAEYEEWLELIEEEGAEIKIARAGGKILSGSVEIQILYPFESMEGKELKDSNDSSVVAKLVFGEKSFLFTGDISGKIEVSLAENFPEIDSDVLKVSHHGSKYSSFDEFISKVSPQVAVIQVGKDNSYGHPMQEVLDRLLKYGIDILRTDRNGDIKIFSDGEKVRISNY
ncbi:MAG: ComEC/Rec2 family competence protein [Parcubacteria group bacterium]